MKENKKLISEILADVRHDMTDEEILNLLASSRISVNPEKESGKLTSLGQRAADSIAKFAGSWAFIFSFTGVLLAWMILNVLLAAKAFDPYPFILLNLVLSCVAAIQAPLIMMSQNRQEEKDRRRAENDYKVNLKTEIMIEDLYDKVNAILAKQFIQEFDGFSIGSNDMTQMVLATDRDNARLSHIYDEEDPAVVWAILVSIFTGLKYGKKVGFCGQGVSNSLILRGLVAIAGITSASVVPDTYYQTVFDIAAVEGENIPTSQLGAWLGQQHHKRLADLMERNGYGHILKKYKEPQDIQEWYEGELQRRHEQFREHLDTPKEDFYRADLQSFRSTFHKPVIYATWNWDETVLDALHHSGFADFDEQAKAMEISRQLNG